VAFYQRPVSGAVVHVASVAQLMNNDVINQNLGHKNQPDVQADSAFAGTTAPAGFLQTNSEPRIRQGKFWGYNT